jgi:hypothetical protein
VTADPCPLCYAGASVDGIENSLVVIEPPRIEAGPETIIAAALANVSTTPPY